MSYQRAPWAEPFERFDAWFAEAQATGMEDPNAMVLATVGAGGRPSARVVLLKGLDERGFVFYTNGESQKGRELAANPNASLSFHWRELHRQVRVEGVVERVTAEEADAYFATRPRISQLGAWASQQSRPLAERARLVAALERVTQTYEGREVPRPPHWGGFRVLPDRLELWVAGEYRLHERTVYQRSGVGWERSLLYP
jgi:pyridoxamine 5'-phosphate oxidase